MAAPLTRRAVAPNYRATASKNKTGHFGHWPPTTEKLCPDAGLRALGGSWHKLRQLPKYANFFLTHVVIFDP